MTRPAPQPGPDPTTEILTYSQALAYLYSHANYEQKPLTAETMQDFNLDRVRRLLQESYGGPLPYPTVHIAGTKGKGSTAAMVESILRAAGHRTGLFTSPHLHTFRERIRVGGEMIAPEDVAAAVNQLAPIAAPIPGLTTFELTTVLALSHFARQGVDLAVVEVGLGGRLDATNIIDPLVAVITPISYDHTQVLGKTLGEIAREKGGIIKRGAQVVSAPQRPQAMRAIRSICRQQGAHLLVLGKDWTWDCSHFDQRGQALSIRSHRGGLTYENLWIPLLGEHQLTNCATAVAVAELLAERGIPIPPQSISQGLRWVRWPGRMEVLSWEPLLVVDGAHNGDSASRLAAALRRHFGPRPVRLIFGASAGKDVRGMFKALLPLADRLMLTNAHHPRAIPPRSLEKLAARWGKRAEVIPSVAEALAAASQNAGADDIICVTGSLFLVGEARKAWFQMTDQPLPETDPPVEGW